MRDPDSWTVSDVLDFEAFVEADDRSADQGALAARDARLWREHISVGLSPEEQKRPRVIFRRWLECRRSAEKGITVGGSWRAGWSWLNKLLVISGALLGATTCFTLLAYQGEEPLNAPHFLVAGVLVPWLPLLIGSLLFAFRVFDGPPLIRHLLLSMARRLARWVQGSSGTQADRADVFLAVAEQRVDRHGPLLLRQAVMASQRFALFFHIGALLALLISGYARDLRFGWESSFLKPQHWDAIVTITASPWSWAAPEARPTLPQIEESRYVRGRHAEDIPPEPAHAWLQYLKWSIIIWGIVPRTVIIMLASAALRRSLHQVTFDYREARALQRRLLDPPFETSDDQPIDPLPGDPRPSSPEESTTSVACWLLRAEEEPLASEALADWAARHLHWQVVRSEVVAPDFPSGNAPVLDALQAATTDCTAVLVVLPNTLDPIAAVADFLRRLGAAASPQRDLRVLLTGAARGDSSAAPTEARVRLWRDLVVREKLNVLLETWTPT